MSEEDLDHGYHMQQYSQYDLDKKDAEIERLKAENQRLKETLDTLTQEVAAAYMKAIGPFEPAGGER